MPELRREELGAVAPPGQGPVAREMERLEEEDEKKKLAAAMTGIAGAASRVPAGMKNTARRPTPDTQKVVDPKSPTTAPVRKK